MILAKTGVRKPPKTGALRARQPEPQMAGPALKSGSPHPKRIFLSSINSADPRKRFFWENLNQEEFLSFKRILIYQRNSSFSSTWPGPRKEFFAKRILCSNALYIQEIITLCPQRTGKSEFRNMQNPYKTLSIRGIF